MDEISLNSNARDGILSTAESEQTVPCSDVARWVSAARPSDGKTAEFCLRALTGLTTRHPTFVYLIERLKCWHFDNHFYPDVFKSRH